MNKFIRIVDMYGVKEEIDIPSDTAINKGDSVFHDYREYTVTQVTHYIEEMRTCFICKVV